MKIEWKFKDKAQPQGSSDGFWYDITSGGYLKPEEVLADDEQLKLLETAIAVVRSFEEALEEAELIIEF